MTTEPSGAHSAASSVSNPTLLPALTIGFGAAVAMWVIGFVTHLPGLRAPTSAVGIAMAVAHLAAGFVCARAVATRVMPTALMAGGVAGGVNLLVLGSLVAPSDPSASLPASMAVIALAYVAGSIVAAAIGAAIARAMGVRAKGDAATSEAWVARFAAVAAVSAAPVVLSGGLVTSENAGLAVHDWPSSYGSLMWLYPLSRMTGGVYYEHAHRLFGSLAGLTVVVLAVLAWARSTRMAPRIAATIAVGLIVVQGVMGGLRVTSADAPAGEDLSALTPESVPPDAPRDFRLTQDNETSRGLAVAHGILGQLTVAWLAVCAVVASPRFGRGPEGGPIPDGFARTGARILLGALVFQLILGATTRHLHHMHLLMTHMVFAFVVLVMCFVVGMRAAKHRGTPLRGVGMAVSHTAGLQVILGFGAMFSVLPYDRVGPDPWHAVLLATAHQATGAFLISSAAMLVAWTSRWTTKGKPVLAPTPA